ncbi:MAG: hypothetical protein AAF352_04210, partial [Pseudomonadota bacterium]
HLMAASWGVLWDGLHSTYSIDSDVAWKIDRFYYQTHALGALNLALQTRDNMLELKPSTLVKDDGSITVHGRLSRGQGGQDNQDNNATLFMTANAYPLGPVMRVSGLPDIPGGMVFADMEIHANINDSDTILQSTMGRMIGLVYLQEGGSVLTRGLSSILPEGIASLLPDLVQSCAIIGLDGDGASQYQSIGIISAPNAQMRIAGVIDGQDQSLQLTSEIAASLGSLNLKLPISVVGPWTSPHFDTRALPGDAFRISDTQEKALLKSARAVTGGKYDTLTSCPGANLSAPVGSFTTQGTVTN